MAASLFVVELTDKDAFLVLAASASGRPGLTFLSGVAAFTLTTGLFVVIGSFMLLYIPVAWVRIAGGVVMLCYGAWAGAGLSRGGPQAGDRPRGGGRRSAAGAFLALVGALVALDVAGDATEVLTIVMVARYADPLLVFTGACAGLYAATALEAAVGSRLGLLLTPRRLRSLSAAVFLGLGAVVLLGSI